MRLETRYINLGEIIREREKFYAYDKMLCVFNFTSVKFLNDDYDDYDLVSRNCMYIFFERDNEDKKFDVVLRSCNKQWPNFSDQHSNVSAKMWSKRGNREILTFLGFVPLLNQRTLRTTVLTGVALIGFCVIWKINFMSKRIVNLKWQKRKIEESIWWWKKKNQFLQNSTLSNLYYFIQRVNIAISCNLKLQLMFLSYSLGQISEFPNRLSFTFYFLLYFIPIP